ncbi:MAG: phage tail protein [Bacteroidia bacterium]|nr:phage tail protein [Bacteroidia bacterium]
MTNYPLTKFRFRVDWGGTKIGFTEVSGLDFKTDVSEYRHGASPDLAKVKVPGLRSFSNITLKRGSFETDQEYYDWWNVVQLGGAFRRNITISLLNEQQDPIVTWNVKNAWPLSVNSTDLNAQDSGIAVESMELTHEGLTVEYL